MDVNARRFSPPLHFNIFERVLIIAIVASIILEIIFSGEVKWVATIAALAGVLSVVLAAKGHIACYFFGLIQVCLYVLVAWESKFYGEVMLNGLYFLPMQVIGFLNWRKNLDKQDLVKAKSMVYGERLILFIITTIATLLYGHWLDYLGGNAPYLDSISTILSIAAMFLMVRAFVEQWILWIVIDVVTIIMWIIALIDHEPNASIMVIMWSLFLVNAVYGYWNWHKLTQKNVQA